MARLIKFCGENSSPNFHAFEEKSIFSVERGYGFSKSEKKILKSPTARKGNKIYIRGQISSIDSSWLFEKPMKNYILLNMILWTFVGPKS